MKKSILFLLLVMSFLLSACGGSISSTMESVATSIETTSSQFERGEPVSWEELSINDGTWGYTTAAADLPEGRYILQCGKLFRLETVYNVSETITWCGMDGQELAQITIPLKPEDGCDSRGVSCFDFGSDGAWAVVNSTTILDADSGASTSTYVLQKWSYEGTKVAEIPLEKRFGLDAEADYVAGLMLDEQNHPLLLMSSALTFCDEQGNPVAVCPLGDTSGALTQDKTGQIYFASTSEKNVFSIDIEQHALGDALFPIHVTESVYPGGGEFDFFLLSGGRLRGVSLARETITEILKWQDWNLAESVSGIAFLDTETYLLIAGGASSRVESATQTLTLSRVPAEDIPEKTVLRLAVPLPENSIYPSPINSLNSSFAEAINQFNRADSIYRLEVESYSSAQALQLQMAAGEGPDMIYWLPNDLIDVASAVDYAKRGYLLNLELLFDNDPDLSTDDFFSNILSMLRDQYGGLYAMPTSFQCDGYAGLTEFVGDDAQWGISEALAIARALPDDIIFWKGIDQETALKILTWTNLGKFVDFPAETCNFETQEFYDMLTLVRDYIPVQGNYFSQETALLEPVLFAGTMGNMVSSTLRDLPAQGRTLIGYPGAEGNGINVQSVEGSWSICAQSPYQDAAWKFLRSLFTYDGQYNASGMNFPIREDMFHDREDWFVEVNGGCTQEESLEARELIYGTKTMRLYDSPVEDIILEEAQAFLHSDKSAEETARIIQNRATIYLGEIS